VTDNPKKRRVEEFSTLDDFLKEEGIYDEVLAEAIKAVIALQLREAMRERKLTKSAMAKLMQTSRAQLDRILDPDEFNVTLDTLAKAARAVGRELRVSLA
jgi:antitoxin HicB